MFAMIYIQGTLHLRHSTVLQSVCSSMLDNELFCVSSIVLMEVVLWEHIRYPRVFGTLFCKFKAQHPTPIF